MNLSSFPDSFKFGFASSSYQIEGGWDSDGKGEHVWDTFDRTPDGSSGEVAADSYHQFYKDVNLLKDLGAQVYRFSLSWARILPNGYINNINQTGLNYYHRLIDELLLNGIEPVVTLFHWDLPVTLQDFGGWASNAIIDVFVDYARLVFNEFGTKVKKWITINEPWEVAFFSYGKGYFPPCIKGHGVIEYLAGHNMLKAHASVYHLYNDNFKSAQRGEVGFALNTSWYEPKTDHPVDVAAAKRYFDFQVGWFAHPVFSKKGDYPAVMKEYIAKKSEEEGFYKSRLPVFDEFWINHIRGSADFYGFNHYTTKLVTSEATERKIGWENDVSATTSVDPEWPATSAEWFKVAPFGIRKALAHVKQEYGDPIIYITENGYPDHGELEDDGRISYHKSYLQELLKALHVDGVNVQMYAAWALLDSFEWTAGYTTRFGIVHVDMNNPQRKRTPKKSAEFFKSLLRERCLQ